MKLEKEIDVHKLHHAYLIEDFEQAVGSLQQILQGIQNKTEVYTRVFDTFGIDDSRELVSLAAMRSLGTQVFIYQLHSCTREAQNALLKLFEEPPSNTHFFLCVSGVQNLLPTLRSRAWVIERVGDLGAKNLGKEFLRANAAERLALVAPFLKEKDSSAIEQLLCDLEQRLYQANDLSAYRSSLQHIMNVRKAIRDRGASLKILTESVVASVPRFSQ